MICSDVGMPETTSKTNRKEESKPREEQQIDECKTTSEERSHCFAKQPRRRAEPFFTRKQTNKPREGKESDCSRQPEALSGRKRKTTKKTKQTQDQAFLSQNSRNTILGKETAKWMQACFQTSRSCLHKPSVNSVAAHP